MTKFARAQEGNKFVITESGSQIPKIKSKYDSGFIQYTKCVPQIWVNNGWVKEVKNGEE